MALCVAAAVLTFGAARSASGQSVDGVRHVDVCSLPGIPWDPEMRPEGMWYRVPGYASFGGVLTLERDAAAEILEPVRWLVVR